MQRRPSIRILSALELRCPVCSSCAACCPSTPGTGTAWDRCVCSCWRGRRPRVHFQLHHAGICCICLLWFTVLYLPLVDLCSSLLRETAEEDVEENPAEFSEDKIWLKACTSFIRTRYVHDPDCRAEPLIDQYLLKPLLTYLFPIISLSLAVRLLLRILQQQQSSFVLQHSENTLKCTDEVLQYLNPKESTLQALTQVRTHGWVCVWVQGHLQSLSVSATCRWCQKTWFQRRWGKTTRMGKVWAVYACRASGTVGGARSY